MEESISELSYRSKRSRWGRILLWVGVGLLIFAGVAYIGVCAYVSSEITKIGDHDTFTNTPATYGVEFETVSFPARGDGLEIAAWYLPNLESSRAMVLVHGRKASKQNAMSGTLPRLGAAIHNAGFAVLIIDLRNHGESAVDPNYPNRYSFGVFERQDVLGAYDFLLDQGFESGRIGVLGTSLGGATTVGAAAEEPGIGLIVLDSTFADLNPMIERGFAEESGLPMFFLPGVLFLNQMIYGYDFRDVVPVNEIDQFLPKPVMIVHCINDEDVEMWHPEKFAEVAPSIHSWFTEDCEHSEIYRDHPDEYEELVIGFIDENLK